MGGDLLTAHLFVYYFAILASVTPPVCIAAYAGAALAGADWTEQTIERAMHALAEDFAPISDMRASASYRLRVAQNMLRRLYLEIRGELPQSVYVYGRQG